MFLSCLVDGGHFILLDSRTAMTRHNMTLNALLNKYILSEARCCTCQTELPPELPVIWGHKKKKKKVKSRSFGVEDLRIEESLWQRAEGTRRQTDRL